MTFKKNNPGCQCCGDQPTGFTCTNCVPDLAPNFMQVVISGASNVSCSFGCTSLNGTFVTAQGTSEAGGCRWIYNNGGVGLCSFVNFNVFRAVSLITCTINFRNSSGGSVAASYQTTSPSGCTYNNFNLPFSLVTGSDTSCNWSGITVNITGI